MATVGQGKDWLSLLMTEFVACVLPWWAGNWWSQRTALTHAAGSTPSNWSGASATSPTRPG